MKPSLLVAVAASVVVAVSTGASAHMSIAQGDDRAGSFWSANFNVTPGPIDLFGFRMFDGGPFYSPAVTPIVANGWTLSYESGGQTPHTFAISGPPEVATISFQIHFAGKPTEPLHFEVAGFFAGSETPPGVQFFTWNGTSFSTGFGSQFGWEPVRSDFRPTVIPLPTPAALAVAGLLGVMSVRRRGYGAGSAATAIRPR